MSERYNHHYYAKAPEPGPPPARRVRRGARARRRARAADDADEGDADPAARRVDRRRRRRGAGEHANTAPFDVTGNPAISVPCAFSDGLPVGLMLVGRHFDDATVLRAAHAYETGARRAVTGAAGAGRGIARGRGAVRAGSAAPCADAPRSRVATDAAWADGPARRRLGAVAVARSRIAPPPGAATAVARRGRTVRGMPALDALRDRLAELADLASLQRLAGWDQRTMMPPGGAPARAQQSATLERLAHDRATADEIGAWLERARRRRRRARRDRRATSSASPAATGSARAGSRASSPPTSRTASAEGQAVWQAARAADDFAAFAPALRRNVELARAYAACFDDVEHPYDALLADYDFGLTAARVREIFGPLAERAARPRRRGRGAAGRAAADGPDRRPAGRGRRDRSRASASTPDSWRVDVSPHPFTSWVGHAGHARHDPLRARRRSSSRSWPRSTSSATALYERQIPPELARTNLGRGTSMSVARVAEQAVGEPRRAPSGVRAGDRGRARRRAASPSTRTRSTRAIAAVEPVAHPRVGRPAHLSAAHRPALRARGRADRGLARGRRPARRVERRDAPPARRGGARRRRAASCRTCTGRAARSATSRATRSAA